MRSLLVHYSDAESLGKFNQKIIILALLPSCLIIYPWYILCQLDSIKVR